MGKIAHKDGDREQSVVEHLTGTAKLAEKFAEKFGNGDWGYCCGMLHDVGKYSEEFQRKIINNTDEKVDHSTAGAQLCHELGGIYGFLSYCIAGHHGGLPDYDRTKNSSGLKNRFKKKICSYKEYEKEVVIPEIHTMPFDLKNTKNVDYSLSVFVRMLYSCLVDADYLDTECFMKNGEIIRKSGESMDVLYDKMEKYVSKRGWLEVDDIDSVNGRRSEILKQCIIHGKEAKGIFRLTVPTGGGKTIASLAFALKHAVEHQMDRIIYVIPYTSIIEQNAQVFRKILGSENVLENHCNVEYRELEELLPMQLASENWDKPVVVTTNVQFFESLYANRSSKCRKLHNIVNSVVIFDEAQMIPLDYLEPCLSMIKELVNNYEVSAVLCTATQPALDSLLDADLVVISDYDIHGKISSDKVLSMENSVIGSLVRTLGTYQPARYIFILIVLKSALILFLPIIIRLLPFKCHRLSLLRIGCPAASALGARTAIRTFYELGIIIPMTARTLYHSHI